MNVASPRTEIRTLRFSKEDLKLIREFSRLWGNASRAVTISLGFKLLKHLSDNGKLNMDIIPLLHSNDE